MVINSNGIAALLLFFNLRKWFQKKNSGRGKEKRSLSYKIKSSLADTGVYLTYSQSIPSSYVAKAMQIIIVAKCTLLTGKKVAFCKSGGEPLPITESANTLILDFPGFRTEKK